MSSVIIAGDTSGTITLAAPAVAGSGVLTLPVATDTLVGKATTDTLTNKTLTAPVLGTPASGILTSCTGLNYDGFKNRIINGAMVIDQRNAGASVTATSTAAFTYTLDRFSYRVSAASKFTVQQNAGSVTPPTGFINYLGVTSSSAYSVSASDFFAISQLIEGLNIADFAWGTANAVPITLSFKVYSSLTGTFGGSIANNGFARCYPFSYTISSANTWTSISITIPGDTSGTWLTTNGIGLTVLFGLGIGSTYSGTAGAWVGSQVLAPTGAVSVVGTNGATFYITGVQLEVGSTATSFDYRPYGTELALCQRYYEKSYDIGTVPGTNTVLGTFYGMYFVQYGVCPTPALRFIVSKRAAPTMLGYTNAGVSGNWVDSSAGDQAVTLTNPSQTGVNYAALASGSGAQYGQWTASAEL